MRTKLTAALALTLLSLQAHPQPTLSTLVDDYPGHPRAIILSDIGNEPDDQMSLVRLLLYSNQIDLEALVATTSTWQKTATHPETMHALIQAYGRVQPNLQLHATGWPTAAALDSRVSTGQPAYGLAATGPGKSTPGSNAILHELEQPDPRPLWICLWGGANTLAQALIDLRGTHSPADTARLVNKLRINSISDQDDAGPWIRREFPTLYYIVQPSAPNSGEYYYATWTGISGDVYYRNGAGADTTLVTNQWLDDNIRSKGSLGKLYPRFAFIMEGDTPSFLNLIDNGLNSYRRPDWGGWGGRYLFRQPYGETHSIWTQGGDLFTRVTSQDSVIGIDDQPHISDQATIWRWREAYQHDFAARMDWTIADYQHANHNPIVIISTPETKAEATTAPIYLEARVNQPITLDATQSHDPDNNHLRFQWFHYPEAGGTGTNLGAVTIANADTPRATITPTAVCRELWIPNLVPCTGTGTAHIILAVTDDGTPTLTSYRRIILTIHPAPAQ